MNLVLLEPDDFLPGERDAARVRLQLMQAGREVGRFERGRATFGVDGHAERDLGFGRLDHPCGPHALQDIIAPALQARAAARRTQP